MLALYMHLGVVVYSCLPVLYMNRTLLSTNPIVLYLTHFNSQESDIRMLRIQAFGVTWVKRYERNLFNEHIYD